MADMVFAYSKNEQAIAQKVKQVKTTFKWFRAEACIVVIALVLHGLLLFLPP
jgi:hypothetical protein